MVDIQIETSVLRSGAAEADAVAGAVDTALQASAVALAPNAFGLLCSPLLLPPYSVVKLVADQTMRSAGVAVRRSASNLRLVADRFDATEQASKAEIGRWVSRL